MTSRFHALAWLIWALAAAISLQLAPSPLYVAVVIGIAALVVQVHGSDGPFARAFPVLLTLGVVFMVIRVALTARDHPHRHRHGAVHARRRSRCPSCSGVSRWAARSRPRSCSRPPPRASSSSA